MTAYLFHGGKFLDPRKADLQEGIEVLIEDDRVKEVSDRPIGAAGANATRIDLRGRTLMPGLIDAHIHIFLAEVNLALPTNGAASPPCATPAAAIRAPRSPPRAGSWTRRGYSSPACPSVRPADMRISAAAIRPRSNARAARAFPI